jgi:hypothetical protein
MYYNSSSATLEMLGGDTEAPFVCSSSNMTLMEEDNRSLRRRSISIAAFFVNVTAKMPSGGREYSLFSKLLHSESSSK